MVSRKSFRLGVKFIKIFLLVAFVIFVLYKAVEKFLKVEEKQKLDILSSKIERTFRYPKIALCASYDLVPDETDSFDKIAEKFEQVTPKVFFTTQNGINGNLLDPAVRKKNNISMPQEELLTYLYLPVDNTIANYKAFRNCIIIIAPKLGILGIIKGVRNESAILLICF